MKQTEQEQRLNSIRWDTTVLSDKIIAYYKLYEVDLIPEITEYLKEKTDFPRGK